jgi:hypothetical protein
MLVPGSNTTFIYVLYLFVAHLLTLPRIIQISAVKPIITKDIKSFLFAGYESHNTLDRKSTFPCCYMKLLSLITEMSTTSQYPYQNRESVRRQQLIKLCFFPPSPPTPKENKIKRIIFLDVTLCCLVEVIDVLPPSSGSLRVISSGI